MAREKEVTASDLTWSYAYCGSVRLHPGDKDIVSYVDSNVPMTSEPNGNGVELVLVGHGSPTYTTHFRRKDALCSEYLDEVRQTIHDRVISVVSKHIKGHGVAGLNDVCNADMSDFPYADCKVEQKLQIGDVAYIPDIVVYQENSKLPHIELEVVFTHDIEKDRRSLLEMGGHSLLSINIESWVNDLARCEKTNPSDADILGFIKSRQFAYYSKKERDQTIKVWREFKLLKDIDAYEPDFSNSVFETEREILYKIDVLEKVALRHYSDAINDEAYRLLVKLGEYNAQIADDLRIAKKEECERKERISKGYAEWEKKPDVTIKNSNRKVLILDIETYRNYWLAMFKEAGSDQTYSFELYDGCEPDLPALGHLMCNNTTISFNGNHYDLYMIAAALQGFDNAKLKLLSDKIILSNQPAWRSARVMDVEIPRTAYSKPLWRHIDLIDVAPGKASLKIYGGRLNAPKLQDLPIDPSADISPSQRDLMRTYCLNDLETTELLHKALSKDLSLRVDMSKQYRVDLRSMGGAQVAKAVLQSELSSQGVSVSKPKSRAGDSFKYIDPGFVSFSDPVLADAFDRVKSAVFKVKDNGQVQMPETLDAAVEFMGGKYKFGIGGLHSQEKCQSVVCDDNHILAERDVASMYPNIILGQGMYPKALGPKFLDVYNTIVQRRLKAKHGATKCTEKLRKLRAELAKLD